jgi:UDP:flavonoid glycosyltransferase YjiC (YdhE family)
MATILAYTSPALGHLLPISALLLELSRRGHIVHLRTLSTGVEIGQRLGFTTDAIDPRIELDDWKATNPIAALKLSVAVFGRRAVHEVTDLAETVARTHPDALLGDVNCWGAQCAADAGAIPWACFSPYTPPLRSPGVPPFGLGLTPMSGAVGRMRDAAVRTAVVGRLEKVLLPPINMIRARVKVGTVASMDEFLRRSPLLPVASGAFPVPTNRLGRCGVDDRTMRA